MVKALIEGVRDAARTTDGLQSFVVTGPASTLTPKGAVFVVTSDRIGDGTDSDEAKMSWGCTDGTFQGGSYFQAEHGVDPSDTDRGAFDDAVIRLPDDGTSSTFAGEAVFSDWEAGGVEIDWTAAPGVAVQVHVTLWFGDDVNVACGTVVPPAIPTPGGTTAVTTTNADGDDFRPDHVYSCSGHANVIEGAGASAFIGLAHAIRTGNKSRELNWKSTHGTGRSRTSLVTGSDLVTWHTATASAVTVVHSTQISSWTATGFEVATSDTTSGTGSPVIYLAAEYGDNTCDVRSLSTESSTGTNEYTSFGFQPWSVLSLNTIHAFTWGTDNTTTARAPSGTFGISFGSDNSEWTAQICDEDNSATMDTSSRSIGKLLSMKNGAASSLLFEAVLDSFGENGPVYDFTTASGTGLERFAVFCLERDTLTATGDADLQRLTGTGSASVSMAATGDADLQRLTGTGTVEVGRVATGAADLQRLTGTGAGAVAMSASGAADLQRLTGTGHAPREVKTEQRAQGAGALAVGCGAGTDAVARGSGARSLGCGADTGAVGDGGTARLVAGEGR